MDPGGNYTPKAGYICLSAEAEGREEIWWWKILWKLKCPAKTKLFMWCVLENRVPTWDVLQRRNFQGPGWCVLCKQEMESIPHLFISCPFSAAVWKGCMRQVGLNHRWDGNSVSGAWDFWWRFFSRSKLKSLPLLITWGIWLARNGAIFKEKVSIPEIISAQVIGLYKALPEYIRAADQRRNLDLLIDKTHPWGFFDGAAQNEMCGGGAVLYLSETHYFTITMGLGPGSNNYAELMSLKLLLIFASERGIKRLSVCGDSLNVINWIKKIQACRNIRIVNILSTVQNIILSYDTFLCQHVYRENNKEADQASKEGLRMAFGNWKISEEKEGQSFEFYHRPFID